MQQQQQQQRCMPALALPLVQALSPSSIQPFIHSSFATHLQIIPDHHPLNNQSSTITRLVYLMSILHSLLGALHIKIYK